jgi:hypothetical protein
VSDWEWNPGPPFLESVEEVPWEEALAAIETHGAITAPPAPKPTSAFWNIMDAPAPAGAVMVNLVCGWPGALP